VHYIGNIILQLEEFGKKHPNQNKPDIPPYDWTFSPLPESEAVGLELKEPIPLENGLIYFGEWRNGQRWGRGVQVWQDGTRYEGIWTNNKANGKADWSMPMEITFKGIGSMIKLREVVLIIIWTAQNMKENGNRMNNTEKGLKHGQMALDMKEDTRKEKSMERDFLLGQMGQNMMENFSRIIFKEKDYINGRMEDSMRVLG